MGHYNQPLTYFMHVAMSYDDPDEEIHWSGEDWSDDEDDLDEEEVARCQECGGPVAIITEKCPSCGRWLSADRQAMWSGMTKPLWLRTTVWVVLTAFLVSLLVAGWTIF